MAQGKSPFELRADLLKLAFEILLAQHSAASNERGSTAPSSEDVIVEAQKLNEFISKSGNDSSMTRNIKS